MASNEVEVLDPAAMVEKMRKIVSGVVLNRRNFMTALGAAGFAAGTGMISEPAAWGQAPSPPGYSQIDVINFLLQVKYLTATYFSYATQGADLPAPSTTSPGSGATYGTGPVYNGPTKLSTGISSQFIDMFNEIYFDEVNSLVALRNLIINQYPAGTSIGETGVAPRSTMNLAGTSAPNTAFAVPATAAALTAVQVIAQARMLKDLSVSAFTNALQFLTDGPTSALPNNGANLTTVAQILAVEGFHSAALRLASIQTGAPFQSTQYVTTLSLSTVPGSTTLYAQGTLPNSTTTLQPLLVIGQPIAAVGIPAGAVITSLSSAASATPAGVVKSGSTIIAGLLSLTGLAQGQPITGTGIPSGATIQSVNGLTITLSAAATATNAGASLTSNSTTFTANTLTGSTLLSSLSSLNGLAVGQAVSGTGIPAGATIAAINGLTATLSAAATATPAALTPTGYLTAGSTTVSGVSTTAGLFAGQAITSTLTFPAMTTSGSAILQGLGNTNGLTHGQLVTGTYIPANATIVSVGTNTVTISANATGTTSAAPSGSGPVTVTENLIPPNTTIAGFSGSATGGTGGTPNYAITLSQPASGTGIFTTSGVVTSGSSTITALTSVTSLVVGQPISGAGIPSGATIAAINGINLNLSAPATASSSPISEFTGVFTSGSTAINTITVTSGALAVGQPLNYPGTTTIPEGTTIASISNSAPTILLSQNATASGSATFTNNGTNFTATSTAGSNTLTSLSSVNGLSAGQTITGAGIPTGTTITGITGFALTMTAVPNAGSTIAPSGNVTKSSTTITTLSFTGGILVGQPITGSFIPTGATITSLNAGAATATISSPATSTNTAGVVNFTTYTDVTVLAGGEILTTPLPATVTTPSGVTLTIGQSAITLSQPIATTVTQGIVTATVVGSDPLDVAPVDIGPGVISTGPAPDPSSLPTVYQGFFATAGTGNATGNTPPGFAYARTFSQVLAALYTSTSPGSFNGGFYPSSNPGTDAGVTGIITTV